MTKQKNYILSADVIRVLAIGMVIAIHTFNMIIARIDFFGSGLWWIANIVGSISRMSIPLFVMLSGYFILQKNESVADTLKRTFYYLIIPLLAWLAIYLLWNDAEPSMWGLASYIDRLVSGGALHLYFLILLIGLYIISPMIRGFIKMNSKSVVAKYAFLFLGIGITLSLAQYALDLCRNQTSFSMWIPYIGYFILGYVLGNLKPSKETSTYAKIGLVTGLLLTILLNYGHLYLVSNSLGTMHTSGCISSYPDYYVSINVALMSISAFVLLFHHKYKLIQENKRVSSLVFSIARATLGIYLVHMLVIQILESNENFIIRTNPVGLLIYVFMKWLIVFLLSYGITIVGMKIPYVKYIFGAKIER